MEYLDELALHKDNNLQPYCFVAAQCRLPTQLPTHGQTHGRERLRGRRRLRAGKDSFIFY